MRLFVKGLLNLPPKPAFAQEVIYEGAFRDELAKPMPLSQVLVQSAAF
jgi:hypothetical protein